MAWSLNRFCSSDKHSQFNSTMVVFLLIFSVLLLTGCGSREGSRPFGVVARSATVALPTPKPKAQPSPQSTRVMPVEVLTPPPTATITPIPDETLGLVVEIVDGDTIAVVLDGDPARRAYQVRYIGIDAPENSPAEPWGLVASEVNHNLTNLKVVRLVRDETDFDSDGYLLRHVYLGDQLVSIILAEQGLARAAVDEPNTQFSSQISSAEAKARAGNLGVWSGQSPTATPGLARPATGSVPITATPEEIDATATGETAEPTEEATEETTTEPASPEPESTTTGTPESQ